MTEHAPTKSGVAPQQSAPEFTPIQMLEVEIGQPLPDITLRLTPSGRPYFRALSLVRLHSRPLGLANIELCDGSLPAAEYARQLWDQLSSEIQAHLERDRLLPIDVLDASGIRGGSSPLCLTARQAFLVSAPPVSVVIPTRDRPHHLQVCLDTLFACEYPEFEVVVVDNAPQSAGTRDLLEKRYAGDGRIRYVREDRLGSSIARARGALEARNEIVAFVDDDVIIDRLWLVEIAKGFNAADNVGCVTGFIAPRELDTPAQVWFEQFGGFIKGYDRRVFDLETAPPNNPLYPYNLGRFGSGNNMAFKRSILCSIGNFDPALGYNTPAKAGEDIDLFLRVLVKGYRLVYEPSAIVHHLHRRDYPGLRGQMYSYGVGMTAVLTSCLIRQPRLVGDFLRKFPRAVEYAFSPHSTLNAKKQVDYPAELTRLHLRGMLYGPLAYVRSWLWWRLKQLSTA